MKLMLAKSLLRLIAVIVLTPTIFMLLLWLDEYEVAHRGGRIINHPPYKTYEIMQPLEEIKLPNDETSIFNGCIINHPSERNKYLLTYRLTYNDFTSDRYSAAGLLTLGRNLKTEQHHTLDLVSNFNFLADKSDQIKEPEDARLFWASGNLHMLYNAEHLDKRSMFLAKFRAEANEYVVDDIQKLNYAPHPQKPQKNWTPFTYQNDLYFIYSANPTEILRYNPASSEVEPAYKISYERNIVGKTWRYGDIRGGTPAIYMPELDAYLTFFHSFLPYKFEEANRLAEPLRRIYFMGAYIFDSKPPFKILAITSRPLTFKGQYKDKKAMHHIIFPCGFVEDNDRFIISTGLGDSKLVLLQIRKRDLYQKLHWLSNSACVNKVGAKLFRNCVVLPQRSC